MRRMAVSALTLSATLVLGFPAEAKGPVEVFVTGPGVDLHLVGDEVFEFPDVAGFRGVRTPVAAPQAPVGPRYELRFLARLPRREVVQFLYPHAKPEPLIYTSPGQRWAIGRNGLVSAGWARAEPGLIEWLEEQGLHVRPGDERSATTVETVPTSEGIPWALLALGGLLGLAAVSGLRGVHEARAPAER